MSSSKRILQTAQVACAWPYIMSLKGAFSPDMFQTQAPRKSGPAAKVCHLPHSQNVPVKPLVAISKPHTEPTRAVAIRVLSLPCQEIVDWQQKLRRMIFWAISTK